MPFIDISIPLYQRMANWPGDKPYSLTWTSRIDEKASVNLAHVEFSLHTGTHADAPLHFVAEGAPIGSADLEVYFGPACVVVCANAARITRADVERQLPDPCTRVLIRTDSWPDWSVFPEAIPVMDPDVVPMLAARGVRLLGIDVPSVDALDSVELPNHNALHTADICIIESLNLRNAEAGHYQLVAFPLPLVGGDASPVRAVLIT